MGQRRETRPKNKMTSRKAKETYTWGIKRQQSSKDIGSFASAGRFWLFFLSCMDSCSRPRANAHGIRTKFPADRGVEYSVVGDLAASASCQYENVASTVLNLWNFNIASQSATGLDLIGLKTDAWTSGCAAGTSWRTCKTECQLLVFFYNWKSKRNWWTSDHQDSWMPKARKILHVHSHGVFSLAHLHLTWDFISKLIPFLCKSWPKRTGKMNLRKLVCPPPPWAGRRGT